MFGFDLIWNQFFKTVIRFVHWDRCQSAVASAVAHDYRLMDCHPITDRWFESTDKSNKWIWSSLRSQFGPLFATICDSLEKHFLTVYQSLVYDGHSCRADGNACAVSGVVCAAIHCQLSLRWLCLYWGQERTIPCHSSLFLAIASYLDYCLRS